MQIAGQRQRGTKKWPPIFATSTSRVDGGERGSRTYNKDLPLLGDDSERWVVDGQAWVHGPTSHDAKSRKKGETRVVRAQAGFTRGTKRQNKTQWKAELRFVGQAKPMVKLLREDGRQQSGVLEAGDGAVQRNDRSSELRRTNAQTDWCNPGGRIERGGP